MAQNPHPSNNLETAHVLFMDVVGFSTHPTYEQRQLIGRLKEVVSNTADYLRYEDSPHLIRRSTGDGMALAFFGDAEAPARCALEVCRALKSHPEIKLRMGIHTGPVMRNVSVDGNEDATGPGMNMAQRVMDCGEDGHILVSREATALLSELPGWKELLHDLGEAVVKHGVRLHLFNLYGDDFGNKSLPPKLRELAGTVLEDGWSEPAIIAGPPAGVNPAAAPYAGPQPFTPAMTDRFFGRRQDIVEMLRLLRESRLVVVYATSGAGKSSLLNTRIRQSLDRQRFEVLIDARVGGTLPEEMDTSEIRNIFTYSAIYSLSQQARPSPLCRLDDYLRTLPREPETQGRVLILDQFEEMFTQYPMRHEDRAGFFKDLIAAMNDDPTLRVILAMRKEYLSDIKQLAEQLPDAPPMQEFRLDCMGRVQALEAITAPIARYAVFAEGVAEEIVDQLNTIRVPGKDGQLVSKRGEFIEMVHLQIVCERLWSSLPEGVTQIKMEHLERAAGEGKTFKEFVVNALDMFYDSTVEKVASSSETRDHGGYSAGLIRLGCIKFVTPALTRTMVRHANGRVGRLPDWIVKQLVKYHLLRAEQRGGELWYELAHDRLAEPVGRWMDPKVNSLLHTADLLEKVLGKALEENGDTLNGYFAKHHDLLAQCQPFRRRVGLFEDEAEFVFRASLVNDELKQMYRWSQRLRKDYPQVRLKVLSDALSAGPAEVRRHAAVLLGLKRDQDVADDLAAMLTRLAQSDDDSDVRRAAAVTLAQLDRRKVYDDLVAGLRHSATRAGAEDALSQIRVAADQRVNAPVFEDRFSRLGWAHRWRIRRRGWWQRLREELPALLFIVIPAALFAAVSAAAFKLLPGYYRWALTQGTPSAGMGAFQGATAGVIWAGFIVFGLTVYNVAFGREYVRKSYLRPFAAIVTGAVCGFVSSMLIIWVVIGVFEMQSLVEIGWVSRKDVRRFSLEFWHYLFIETRYGWPYLITGTGLGVGMALTTNGLLASGRWLAFLKKQNQLTGFKQTGILLRGIKRILVRHAWPLPVVLLLAGLLAYSVPEVETCAENHRPAHSVPEVGTGAKNLRPCKSHLAEGLIGDCLTQMIGAFFGIVGMGFGIVIVTWGVRLEPRVTWGLHLKRRNK
ncbi:MAG TPA: HEAT repeat domain-containing protein [Pyrinomonadaceae bacterium]|nr:HEAT repeat domain-containing protein [Pyrinomonadaceae bacterium]